METEALLDLTDWRSGPHIVPTTIVTAPGKDPAEVRASFDAELASLKTQNSKG